MQVHTSRYIIQNLENLVDEITSNIYIYRERERERKREREE